MEMLILILVVGIALVGMHSVRRPADATTTNAALMDDSSDTAANAPMSVISDDIYTNPAYSHIPGNIHQHLHDETTGGMFDDDLCTNPAYSFLECNIFHRDDDWHTDSSSSSFGMDD